jgi:hypothetical protein
VQSRCGCNIRCGAGADDADAEEEETTRRGGFEWACARAAGGRLWRAGSASAAAEGGGRAGRCRLLSTGPASVDQGGKLAMVNPG